jgi:transcriptional regulator with XRE-family HTH domain
MNDWERAICRRVKTIRESIKWSQSSFAEQLGITRDQLASIECGRTPLRYEIAWNIRQAFGISLRWLEEGWGHEDDVESDNLPIPSATGLPERALLSVVAQTFSQYGDENLVAIGPEDAAAPVKGKSDAVPKFTNQVELLNAVMKALEGDESSTGHDDIANRELLESQLKILVGGWIARIPKGHAYEFTEELNRTAEHFIRSFPEDPPDVIDRRSEKITWERIKKANAKKILVAAQLQKKDLTDSSLKSKTIGVKSEMQKLIEQVRRKASKPGAKSALARALGVVPARISEWLSGKKEPGGDYTLKLLHWVRSQERHK